MPRDGSGIYTKPFSDVVTGTTIESAVHNGTIADVETDLNAPRPIIAGGTGANNATAARDNLDAEVASVQVTNYDSHVFESGSFWSSPGATGAPVAEWFFAGICIKGSASALIIVARPLGQPVGTPVYARERNLDVWGAWRIDGDERYVNIAGDTMTGSLTVQSSVTANGEVLAGTNVRAAGFVMAGDATGGTYYFNNAATKSLSYNGALFSLFGGDLSVAGSITGLSTVHIKAQAGNNAILSLDDETLTSKGTLLWDRTANKIGLRNPSGHLLNIDTSGGVILGQGFYGRTGSAGATVANVHNLNWTGGAVRTWVDTVDLGTINITSDYRIKKDVIDLGSTWDTVKALRPISYTQAEFTPPSQVRENATPAMFPADDIERWGFIAHELQETLIPSAASAVKDAPDAIQSPNPWTVIAALTSALQEAMARIEALEGAGAVRK